MDGDNKSTQVLTGNEILQIYVEHEDEIKPIWEKLVETVGECSTMRDAVEEWLVRQAARGGQP